MVGKGVGGRCRWGTAISPPRQDPTCTGRLVDPVKVGSCRPATAGVPPPIHPGGMLPEEFLKPLGVSQSAIRPAAWNFVSAAR